MYVDVTAGDLTAERDGLKMVGQEVRMLMLLHTTWSQGGTDTDGGTGHVC